MVCSDFVYAIYTISTANKPSKISDPILEGLKSEICLLKDFEKKLAEKYEIPIDSVTVRQTAQARAVCNFDADASWEWSQMHILYHRRKKLAHLQMFGHTESEPPPSSAPKVRPVFLLKSRGLNSILAATIQY